MKSQRARFVRCWLTGLLLTMGAGYACAVQAAPDVPLPPDVRIAQVAKRIIYNGLDMHATVFRSNLPQQQVVDFYKSRWGRQATVSTLQSSKIVGHLEDDKFVTVQVSAAAGGSKGTIGVVRLPPKGAPRPQLGTGLPRPSGTRVVNDISYPDDRTPARTVVMIDKLSPAQNGSWFRSRLIAKGWKDANTNKCDRSADHCVLQFERGQSRMMFVAQRGQGRSEILMNILNPSGD